MVANKTNEVVQLMNELIGLMQQYGQEGAAQWSAQADNMSKSGQISRASYIACMAMADSCRAGAFQELGKIQQRAQLFMNACQMIENKRQIMGKMSRGQIFSLIEQMQSNGLKDFTVVRALKKAYNIDSTVKAVSI